jgi:hypothetical protein
MLKEIFEEINNEEFFTPPKNLQKSEDNRHVKDNGEHVRM